MNLDDYISFKQIDPQDIITLIDHLPDQLETAWQLGQVLDLPAWEGLSQIVVTGLGGSAIGADLLAAYIAPRSRLSLIFFVISAISSLVGILSRIRHEKSGEALPAAGEK